MIFSSTTFLFLFLPLVLVVNVLLRRTWLRNIWLFAMSLFFYAWGEQFFVMLMLASIVLNYICGLLIERYRHRRFAGRAFLSLAITINLGFLGFYKYANFLTDSLNVVLQNCGLPVIALHHVHLPIGISFFTFQALSYVVDVYRGDTPAQRNPFSFGLFISLFPQLIAGPIIRYKDISAQIAKRIVSLELFTSGIRRLILGLAKKMILANTFAVAADRVFSLPAEDLTVGVAWTGCVAYALQIYFDFSGYSDMAIGMARMFGFRFLENFNYPYIASSIREFWRRWHISLSTWFRDYLYIPLGGNRGSTARTGANLVIVFFLCGLWHGASWTFVIWGLYHGLFLLLERTRFGERINRLPKPIGVVYMLLTVLVGWVFFRADTLPYALAFLGAMAGAATGDGVVLHAGMLWDREFALAFVFGVVASTPVWPLLAGWVRRARQARGTFSLWLPEAAHLAVDFVILPALFIFSTMQLARGTYNPFIYFRF